MREHGCRRAKSRASCVSAGGGIFTRDPFRPISCRAYAERPFFSPTLLEPGVI
jgi:hypothetical protein